MLAHLHIRHYALINELDIDFTRGFSVLTGETGAGKSIILGALNLVMGGKADPRTITEGEDKCVIEALFQTDNGDESLVRRELNRNGRSRSFVNDEVVSQAELKQLAAQLIDIHSQHANLLIGDDTFQLQVVDAIAFPTQQTALLNQYLEAYTDYCDCRTQLSSLMAEAKKAQQEADYVQFQFKQLDEADLHENEQDELTEEEYRLSHAEQIRESLQYGVQLLTEEDNSVLSLLHSIHLDSASASLAERLHSATIELEDIAHEAQQQADTLESDPQRLQQVQERLAMLQELIHKHHCQTVAELIALRDSLQNQCLRIDSYDEDIKQLKQLLQQKELHLTDLAQQLTLARKSVVPLISETLKTNLRTLGMAHAEVDVQITQLDDFTPSGKDNVQFMFAANLNQSLRRVSEIASGGEISRIMLCIKALTASTRGLPTIIFDEIDTGISGEVASQMGRIMRQMAASRQIIAITHLPQIAAAAEEHYRVYKSDTAKRTETHIQALNTDARVQEIASMLAGKNITEAAIQTAQELLKKQ